MGKDLLVKAACLLTDRKKWIKIWETSFIKTKNRPSNNNRFISFHKKIDYSYVKAKVETGLSEEVLKKLLNNNKNLQKKEAMKKLDIEKKQSLLKKCKASMNKTIESFKTMASN